METTEPRILHVRIMRFVMIAAMVLSGTRIVDSAAAEHPAAIIARLGEDEAWEVMNDTSLLGSLSSAGVTGLAVDESALARWNESPDLVMVSGSEILALFRVESIVNLYAWREASSKPIRPERTYIMTPRLDLFEGAERLLGGIFGPDAVAPYGDGSIDFARDLPGNYILEVSRPKDEVEAAARGLMRGESGNPHLAGLDLYAIRSGSGADGTRACPEAAGVIEGELLSLGDSTAPIRVVNLSSRDISIAGSIPSIVLTIPPDPALAGSIRQDLAASGWSVGPPAPPKPPLVSDAVLLSVWSIFPAYIAACAGASILFTGGAALLALALVLTTPPAGGAVTAMILGFSAVAASGLRPMPGFFAGLVGLVFLLTPGPFVPEGILLGALAAGYSLELFIQASLPNPAPWLLAAVILPHIPPSPVPAAVIGLAGGLTRAFAPRDKPLLASASLPALVFIGAAATSSHMAFLSGAAAYLALLSIGRGLKHDA